MTRPLVMTLALAASALRAASSAAGPPTVTPSRLALPGLVAQRTIEREWTTAKDTGVVRIPGIGVELRSVTLSAIVPGAGQLAAGEGRGVWFLVAEASAWGGWWLTRRDGHRLRDDARSFAGPPADSASAWSFERWAEATGGDPAYLEALYGADRSAFDQAIGSDARYAAGWKDIAARERFGDLKRRADDRLGLSRGFETGLWINHVVGALDALRAARVRRIRLYPGVDLKADGTLRRGRPQLVFALERRF